MILDRPADRRWVLQKPGAAAPFDPALRRLTQAAMKACLWPDEEEGELWTLGDHRQLTVEIAAPGGPHGVVRAWSAPNAGVVYEVAATRAAPTGVPPRRRATVLRRLGLEPLARGRQEWRRELPPLDEAGCASLALSMLEVLTDAFGWDGGTALHARLSHGTALERDESFLGLRAHHLEGLLRDAGLELLELEEDEPEPNPAFMVQAGAPLPFRAELDDPLESGDGDRSDHATLAFSLGINVEDGDALELALALHAVTSWARVELPAEDRVLITRRDSVEGITVEGLRAVLERWMEELAAVRTRLEAGLGPNAGRGGDDEDEEEG